MTTKEKIEKLINTLNEGAKHPVFKIENKEGKDYFVLDIPNMGRFIEIPVDLDEDDKSDPSSSV